MLNAQQVIIYLFDYQNQTQKVILFINFNEIKIIKNKNDTIPANLKSILKQNTDDKNNNHNFRFSLNDYQLSKRKN